MKLVRLNGTIAFILIYLGGNFDLVAIFIVLHHGKKTNHECTKKTTNIGQSIVILLEGTSYRERKTGLANIELNVLSGIRNNSGSEDISLGWLIDYSSHLLVYVFPGPQAFICIDSV